MAESKYPELNDPRWLQAKYAISGANSIADEVGCSAGTVRQALRRHGIRLRPGTVPFKFSRWTDQDLTDAIADAGATREFARIHGTSQSVVLAEMRRRGLNVDDVQDHNWRACKSRTPALTDANIQDIADLRRQGHSVDSIAETYGVSAPTVWRMLRLSRLSPTSATGR
jgi:DNA-binding CsgD family transcriptional regulator